MLSPRGELGRESDVDCADYNDRQMPWTMTQPGRPIWVLLALWAAAALTAQEPHFILLGEQVLSVKVLAVRPNGAVVLDSAERKLELRLADIRLPETGSPAREAAAKLLEKRLLGKLAAAHVRGLGSPGEPWTGYLVVDEVDVRIELVRRGLARYCPTNMRELGLAEAEQEARSARRGVWAQRRVGRAPACAAAADGRGN